jgi:hypothetical protein
MNNQYKEGMMIYDEIYILSGGKTGSKTLLTSFMRLVERLSLSTEVIHMHQMRHNPRLFRTIRERQKRILIVNSYRLPFSRHVSSLFQNIRLHVPQLGGDHHDSPLENTPENVEILRNYMDQCMNEGNFFASNHSFLEDLPFPLPPFDKTAKFTFCPRAARAFPAVDLLMLRFDQIDHWEEQIRTVFPSFVLIPHNVTSTKHFAELYHAFKSTYSFPSFAASMLWTIERPRLQYYFEEEEIEKIWVEHVAKKTQDV